MGRPVVCMLNGCEVCTCFPSYSTLSQVLHAVAALLYPFTWQHTFISIVPSVLIDVVMAPTPYLLGVQKNKLDDVIDQSDVSVYGRGECVLYTYCTRWLQKILFDEMFWGQRLIFKES